MTTKGLVLLLAVFALLRVAHACHHEIFLRATNQAASPDGVLRVVSTFNGTLPGPALVFNEGDTVHIAVLNEMSTESLSVHWHGLCQYGTPYADGAEGVTQMGMPPGQIFHYRFTLQESGTYFYHAHGGLQLADGLSGPLVVHARKDYYRDTGRYHAELQPTIIMGWSHKQGDTILWEVAADLPAEEPDTVIVNGKGRANCSQVVGLDCNTDNLPYEEYHVEQGKTYRLRLVNAGAIGITTISIDGGHLLTVIEADGTLTEPIQVTSVTLYPGQRYSVLFTADKPVDNYWIRFHLKTGPVNLDTTGILRYKGASPNSLPVTEPTPNTTPLDVTQLHPLVPARVPTKVDKNIHLQFNASGSYWTVNGVSYMMPEFPPLVDAYLKKDNYRRVPTMIPFDLSLGDVVNVVMDANKSPHPMHLHGQNFFVLGYGNGRFDPVRDGPTLNTVNPIARDTVAILDAAGIGGWAVIRFTANNPGAWLFHCHVLSHVSLGLANVFVTEPKKIPAPPQDYRIVMPWSWYRPECPKDEEEGPANEFNFIFSGMIPAKK